MAIFCLEFQCCYFVHPFSLRYWLECFNYAPLRRRECIFLCTCQLVGWSVCLSVCPCVTFSFPINNSRTGSNVKVTGVQICQNHFWSITGECLDQPSSYLVDTSILGSRWTLLILRSLGKRSRLNVPKTFQINNLRMPWPTFLKLSPHIHPGKQRNPIDIGVKMSKVKVTKVKCSKTISNCLGNNFPKWISSSYICAYFILTYPVVQNICDKKSFRRHNVSDRFSLMWKCVFLPEVLLFIGTILLSTSSFIYWWLIIDLIMCVFVLFSRNLAIGIGIQNFPEGLAVSLPLKGSGMSTFKCFW